uniref:MULE transposase domain-containing protein n=1 Tax=Amphimedon queenslandica TaxID=400682 RepID=A0A1X7TU77_AMPQE
KWQKHLLQKYGNVISLIDVTYKTTKYELPPFFICIETNGGYSIFAQFITQFQAAYYIEEA